MKKITLTKFILISIKISFITLLYSCGLNKPSELNNNYTLEDSVTVIDENEPEEKFIDDGYETELLFAGFYSNMSIDSAYKKLAELVKDPKSNFSKRRYNRLGSDSSDTYIAYRLMLSNEQEVIFSVNINSIYYFDDKTPPSILKYLNNITLSNSSTENDKINEILELYKSKYGDFKVQSETGYKFSPLESLVMEDGPKEPKNKYNLNTYSFPKNKNLSIIFEKEYPTEYEKNTYYNISINYSSTRLLDFYKTMKRNSEEKIKETKKQVTEDI